MNFFIFIKIQFSFNKSKFLLMRIKEKFGVNYWLYEFFVCEKREIKVRYFIKCWFNFI